MQRIQCNPSDCHPENDANCTVEPLTSTLKMKQNGLDSLIVVLYSGTPFDHHLKMKQNGLDSVIVVLKNYYSLYSGTLL